MTAADGFLLLKKKAGNLDFWIPKLVPDVEEACRLDNPAPEARMIGTGTAQTSEDSGIRIELLGACVGLTLNLQWEIDGVPGGASQILAGATIAEAAADYADYLKGATGVTSASDGGALIAFAHHPQGHELVMTLVDLV